MSNYASLTTLKQGFKSLQASIKAAKRATRMISVIVAASILATKEERESIGMKTTSKAGLRTFFRNHFGIKADSAEGKAVSRAVSYGIDISEQIDKAAIMELNSFGSVCDHIDARLVEIDDAMKAEKAAMKAEKQAEDDAEHEAEIVEVLTEVSEPVLTKAGFYSPDFELQVIEAVLGDLPRLSDVALSQLAISLQAEMVRRNTESMALAA